MEERFTFLHNVVRLANDHRRSYPVRIRSLLSFLVTSFRLSSASLHIVDEDRKFLTRLLASFGPNRAIDCLIPLGEGIVGRAASTLSPVAGAVADLCGQEHLRGGELFFYAEPVLSGRHIQGVLLLGFPDDARLTSTQNELLQLLVAELAGLIVDMRLAERSSRRVDSLTALNDLSKIVSRGLVPQKMLKEALSLCHERSGACASFLRILPHSALPGNLLRRNKPRARPVISLLVSLEKEASQRVLLSKAPLLVTELVCEEELPPSYVTVPLIFEERLFGTLTLFGKGVGRGCANFDEEDRELCESMGLMLANALEGALTYGEMVRATEEKQRRLRELAILYRISNSLLSTTRLNRLIHLTLASLTAGSTPFFDRAMLFLVNEKSGIMQGMLGVTRETVASQPLMETEELSLSPWDMDDEEMQRQRHSLFNQMVMESRLPLDRRRNLSSQAVLERRIVQVKDVHRRRVVDWEFTKRFGIRSFVAAPLMAKSQVVGLVIVDNGLTGREISSDDLRFLQLITSQAGIAIENSLLYKRIEDAHHDLREAQERIIQNEKLAAIGEMAASIAHELKNPMVAVGGFARRLRKSIATGSEEWQYADTIVREVSRLEQMLKEVLSYSRQSKLQKERLAIAEVVEDALATVSLTLAESGIEVLQEGDGHGPLVEGDRQQLKQVFINLFLNAQEAMRSGGRLVVSVSSSSQGLQGEVAVTVSDSGGGIPVEVLANIFNPFFTTKSSGTGLGLPIAHRIITAHAGRIEIDNRPGIGAAFTVVLPSVE
ncbi:MAG TPA: ATP-binding protein [Geobacterales bacterium]|nr:ATP-binding protein [Geobacterales bacterium]